MTSATIHAAGPGLPVEDAAGPLEQRHLQYANYRAVADGSIAGENASFGSGLAQRARIAAQS
jgi:hypothetical protein